MIPQQQFAPLQAVPTPSPDNTPASSDLAKEPEKDENVIEFKAQMVGTFFVSPSPDSPPFVKDVCTWLSKSTTCSSSSYGSFPDL